MNLYQIDQAILDCIDADTGEIIDAEKLDKLQMDRDRKLRNCVLLMKNLKSDIAALKQEKETFANRQKTAENMLESVKKYVSGYLNGQSVKTPEYAVSFRKVKGTDITDPDIIPLNYWIEQDPKLDKQQLLADLKAGVEVPGALLKESLSMTVK